MKKVLLEISQNSQENTCNFIKKETLAQLFSCEFCQISKNTFFTEHLWTTASTRSQVTNINTKVIPLNYNCRKEGSFEKFGFCLKKKGSDFPEHSS